MLNQFSLRCLFLFFLSAYILVAASPLDTQGLGYPAKNAGVWEPRSLKEKLKKFLSSKKGSSAECPAPAAQAPTSGTNIEALFAAVPLGNTVGVGAVKHFAINPPTSATFTTKEFYGCTVVVAVDGKGVVIGHFAQLTGTCTTMTNQDSVDSKILEPLGSQVDMIQYTKAAHVLIITSSSTTTIGYKSITEFFTEAGVPAGNIIPHKYTATGAGGAANVGKPNGKVVVQVTPSTAGGFTVHVFTESDTPTLTLPFDASGNPC